MSTQNKSRVKLNLKSYSLEEKIGYARQIVSSLTNNKDFPSPVPALASVTAIINAAETANADLKNARKIVAAKMSVLEDKDSELDTALNSLGAFVDNIAKGNETLIRSAGMDVREKAKRIGIPPAPDNVAAAAVNEGEISLSWNAVEGAKSYVVQVTKDITGASGWEHFGVPTKSKATVSGLTSGTKYWFRVATVGSAGQSPWSDPCTKYVI